MACIPLSRSATCTAPACSRLDDDGERQQEATAQLLLLEGARVVIAGQFPDRLEAAAESLRSDGGEVHPVVVDVTQTSSVDALRDTALAKLGRIDFLVNAAG